MTDTCLAQSTTQFRTVLSRQIYAKGFGANRVSLILIPHTFSLNYNVLQSMWIFHTCRQYMKYTQIKASHGWSRLKCCIATE